MKNRTKILFLIIGVIGLVGCSGSDSAPLTEEELIITEIETGHQKTTFLVTDAASDDFKSVRVDIQSPIVVATNQGNISVPLPDGLPVRVDLLALEGVSDIMARHEMPAGTIQTITLTLANPEIVLLDDTRLDASQIDLTPNLTLTPTSLAIPETGGSTVEVDIDVAKSIQRDSVGKPIFKPHGSVRHIGPTDTGAEAAERQGIIASIPGIKDRPNSFLLRFHDRSFFVPVDASSAVIFNPQQTTFSALQKGQRVRVGGVFTSDVFTAKRVFIIPENHRILRGVVTNLNQTDPVAHTFDLRFPPFDRVSDALVDGIASDTIKVRYNPTNLHIRMERPEMPLQVSDLTNGQLIGVHGAMNAVENRLEAQVILIHPEKFIGFIADTAGCPTGLLQMVYPSHVARRLSLAGTALDTPQVGTLEQSGVNIIGLNEQVVSCNTLERGAALKVFGRIIPHTPDAMDKNSIRVKAIELRQVPVNHAEGKVVYMNPENRRSFRLSVSCASLKDLKCDSEFLEIHVELSRLLPDPGPILAVGKTVSVAGLLESRLLPTDTNTQKRFFYLLAVAIKGVNTSVRL